MLTKRITAKKTPTRKSTSTAGIPFVADKKAESRLAEPHEVLLSPVTQNAAAMQAWGDFAGVGQLEHLVDGLRQNVVDKILVGNMHSVEAMLYGQAMTLQTMFTNLARRAVKQEYLKQYQTYIVLALKAQAQCRSTLEALAEIKNPRPVSFVKQANISNGPQQVNNGTPGNSAQYAQAHAGENAGQQNELLEHQHGNYLDTGAQGAAGGADTRLEAVEAGQRATHA